MRLFGYLARSGHREVFISMIFMENDNILEFCGESEIEIDPKSLSMLC